ncbi:hypothetical protein RGQ15_14805 [Paracoccus sp. MBLB3053]|uniref:Uncharacterized protein n=1 Tax=Paracoccus aurantius TaxID=3073814 RepID=A0ABU2HUV3_9RHOB|nr:hypothetical protein [Paracoccus sp. MBLB3053]MDS9468833.1 hypothetical protein [Paracoccus sp. MBLB3053]
MAIAVTRLARHIGSRINGAACLAPAHVLGAGPSTGARVSGRALLLDWLAT